MDALLTIDQLSYQQHHQHLFQNLTFTVNPGEIVAIYGGMNSGKSILTDIISGFAKPGGGRISGTTRIAVVTQQFIFYPDLTVRENLEFGAVINNFPEAKLAEIITATGLAGWERQRAGRIPAALKPMLQLASALAREFDLLVLDEVTTGFDTRLKQVFWRLMVQLRDEGKGIVLLTGQWDDANRGSYLINLPSGKKQAAKLQQTVPGYTAAEIAGFETQVFQAATNLTVKMPDEESGLGEVIL